MREIRELLRLKFDLELSDHKIAVSLQMARSSVKECLERAQAAGCRYCLAALAQRSMRRSSKPAGREASRDSHHQRAGNLSQWTYEGEERAETSRANRVSARARSEITGRGLLFRDTWRPRPPGLCCAARGCMEAGSRGRPLVSAQAPRGAGQINYQGAHASRTRTRVHAARNRGRAIAQHAAILTNRSKPGSIEGRRMPNGSDLVGAACLWLDT